MKKTILILFTGLFVSTSSFADTADSKFSLTGFTGYQTFTSTLGDIYSDDSLFGLSVSYFINPKFAVQASYSTASHAYSLSHEDLSVAGEVTTESFALHGKYFINKNKFAPYIIGGASTTSRSTSAAAQPLISAKDSATSFDIGAGFHYSISEQKNFIRVQLLYSAANFSNEKKEILLTDDMDQQQSTGIFPKGDPLALHIGFGVNF